MLDLHLHRAEKELKPEQFVGTKFYEMLFPIKFELSVPKDYNNPDWLVDLTVYISANCEEPNENKFQKMVKGKKTFDFDT